MAVLQRQTMPEVRVSILDYIRLEVGAPSSACARVISDIDRVSISGSLKTRCGSPPRQNRSCGARVAAYWEGVVMVAAAAVAAAAVAVSGWRGRRAVSRVLVQWAGVQRCVEQTPAPHRISEQV